MKKKMITAAAIGCAMIMAFGSVHASESISKEMSDPVYEAVYNYTVDEFGKYFDKTQVSIPCLVIAGVDESDPDDILVGGDFEIFNYDIDGDTLVTQSGGSFPGMLHLTTNEDGSCTVTKADMVEDGEGFTESAQNIFGDLYEEFMEIYSDSDAKDDIRAHMITDYVIDNGIDIAAYQDYGWDPVVLPAPYEDEEMLADEADLSEDDAALVEDDTALSEDDAALSEDDAALFEDISEAIDERGIEGEILDGNYVLRVPVDADDPGEWIADDMSQDDSVVKLASAELKDGVYTITYEPTGDGVITAAVRHITNGACDRLYTYDLEVKDGKATGVTGGSYTESPSNEMISEYITGEWLEAETQFTQAEIIDNPAGGFDVTIISPATHGSFIIKATMYYDCETDNFVYENGSVYEVPITDSEEEDPGEAVRTDASGTITIIPDEAQEKIASLEWRTSENPEDAVAFVK